MANKNGNGAQSLWKLATTTNVWRMVFNAARRETPGSRETDETRKAREALCRTYWYPVYAFVRHRHSAEEARDLTQGFFTKLLERNDIAAVDRNKGKFRCWLRRAVISYLANEEDWNHAQVRYPGKPLISIDATEAEGRYRLEPAHDVNPERIYERRWALALLERTLHRLREDYEEREEGALFEKLKLCLVGLDDEKHKVMAEALGMRENTFNARLSRCRDRYEELLKDEIAKTVSGEGQITEERRYLRSVLTSR